MHSCRLSLLSNALSQQHAQGTFQANILIAAWNTLKTLYNSARATVGLEPMSPVGQITSATQLGLARRLFVATAFAQLSPGAPGGLHAPPKATSDQPFHPRVSDLFFTCPLQSHR